MSDISVSATRSGRETMRRRAVVAGLSALLSLPAAPILAQWVTVRLPDTPRNADGTPNLSAPTPRSADGKPDLSGIWRLDYAAVQSRRPDKFQNFGKTPIGLDWLLPPGEEIPMLPAVAALSKQRTDQLGKDSPSTRCLPHAIPDAVIFSDFKIVQTPRLTVILIEEFNHFRQIATDGRSLPENDPQPTWFGYSVGRWEGDTFIVETAGFNDRSWLGDTGVSHTERLRTTETFARRDFGHLDLRVAIDDPGSFSRAWSLTLPFVLQPDTEMFEGVCDNERDSAHLVGR
jgi:hypothetical protein